MFNLLKTRESREASKFVLTKYQVKFNPKTKNIQTDFLYQSGCWNVLDFSYFQAT